MLPNMFNLRYLVVNFLYVTVSIEMKSVLSKKLTSSPVKEQKKIPSPTTPRTPLEYLKQIMNDDQNVAVLSTTFNNYVTNVIGKTIQVAINN